MSEQEDYAPVDTCNDESPQRIPYVGELFQSLPDMASMLMMALFGDEPVIWEVSRLNWYEEDYDPETDEYFAEELLIDFVDVLDPGNTLTLNFVDLDIEMEKFVF